MAQSALKIESIFGVPTFPVWPVSLPDACFYHFTISVNITFCWYINVPFRRVLKHYNLDEWAQEQHDMVLMIFKSFVGMSLAVVFIGCAFMIQLTLSCIGVLCCGTCDRCGKCCVRHDSGSVSPEPEALPEVDESNFPNLCVFIFALTCK